MSDSTALEPTERPYGKRRMQSHDEKDEQVHSSGGITAFALNIATLPLRSLRPLLPHLFPLLVCLLSIPLLMFFSGAAGWVVWKNVPVGWKADVFLQYGEAVNPFAVVNLPPILADQPYDISLHLVLPATDSNYALGNFMATLRLATANNESLTTVRRPTTLVPPRASLLRQVLWGGPATIKLEIPLVTQFVSSTSTVHAHLEMGRSDGWKGLGNGQGRELSVLDATLKGTVRPRGILAILARYPRLTTFASTFAFFFVSLLVVCAFLFTAFRTDLGTSQYPPSHSPVGGSDRDDSPDEKQYSGRLVKRESTSRSESSSGSGSSPPADQMRRLPSTSTPALITELGKRRSSPAIETSGLDTPATLRRLGVKIEDIPSRRGALGTPPPYPKSPYPRPESAGSNPGSQRQGLPVDPDTVSPSDADAESS